LTRNIETSVRGKNLIRRVAKVNAFRDIQHDRSAAPQARYPFIFNLSGSLVLATMGSHVEVVA
jgi:hypothetical protein